MLDAQLKYERGFDRHEADLDIIFACYQRFKQARDTVREKFTVRVHFDPISFRAIITGEEKDQFIAAVSTFIDLAGIPLFVEGAYNLVEEALEPFGKHLDKGWFQPMPGKAVV